MLTLYLYFKAIVVYWWAFMMAGPLVIDESLRWIWPTGKTWLDRSVPRDVRRRLEIALMLFGVFLAGFLAWMDEYKKVVELERPLIVPNKYICTASFGPQEGRRYVLLMEFGVKNRDTNGQTVGVRFASKYLDINMWFGPPLRTDITPWASGGAMVMGIQEKKLTESYAATISMPSINPRRSLYLKFDAGTPLMVLEAVFIDDALITMQSDPIQFADLSKQPLAKCPRLQQ
jgi:hypothetical protein